MDMISVWMGRNVDSFSRDEAISALKDAIHILQDREEMLAFSREIKAYDPRLRRQMAGPRGA